MNITLYLVGKKGFHVLNSLLNEFGDRIVREVVLAHDEGVDNDFYNDIVDLCEKYNLPFYDRKIYYKHTGYALAIGWKWMLKPDNLIIIHDSLLPKYRGFIPLVNMLINKEEYIGVTALMADETYDTGPIITQVATKIKYPIKINEAIHTILENYAEASVSVVKKILDGNLIFTPQNDSRASYSVWRDVLDYRIDWNKDSAYIRRFVDAVGSPYKGAITNMNDRQVRVIDVEEYPDVVIEGDRPVGKVIFIKDDKPVVICGSGLIKINKMIHNEFDIEVKMKSFKTRFK